MLYFSLGRFAEAESLLRRVLSLLEKAVGPNHPNIVKALINMAALYEKLGNREKFATYSERAKAMQERLSERK